MLQQADLRDHPPQRAGQRHDKNGDQRSQQHAAQHVCQRRTGHRPVDDHRRKDHDSGIQQSHQVNAQQPGGQQHGDRNGHGQQQVVILRQIQAGIGIEHAAEHAEEHRQKSHQRKIQPAHARLCHGRTHFDRKQRENAAQNNYHQHREHSDIRNGRRLGTGFVLFRVVIIGAENFHQLLFEQEFQHDSPSSSRNTSSRESSPLTSSMVPERMSLPPLMMATLSQSP